MAKPKPFDERHLDREWLDQHLAEERREADLLGEIREALFGMQDGLVSTVAVVSTVGGATGDRYPVVVAGIASALAGVFSMAAGEYLSSKRQREIYLAQIEKERAEVDERPEEAQAEVAYLLEAEGLSEASARRVAAELSHAPNALLKTMVEKELGLVVEEGHGALQGAVIMGASFGLASLVPIVPYLIAPPNVALVPSLVVSALVVFAIGVVKSRWTRRNPIASGLEIVVHSGASAEIAYPHEGHADGDVIRVGELAVRCVATPGHTPEHMAYLVSDLRRADDPQYLFSGGALLVGHIARVDLLGPELEEKLARSAYETLRERVLPLADYVAVFPTHGGGSACTARVGGSRWTSLGCERRHNHVARAASADYASFRAAIAEGLPVAPADYPHVRAMNSEGAQLSSRSPLPFLRDTPRGAVLIDPRPPHLFGAGHRREALNVVGNDSFAVRVGAIVPFAAPVVMLTVDPEQP